MQDIFFALIFSIGFVLLSMLLSVFGVLKDKYWLVIMGAVLFIPFSYYMFGASSGNVLAFLPPLLQIGAAGAVYKRKKLWAWILLAPSLLEAFWILGAAFYYNVVA